jgi:hypothetical protein
LTKMVTLLQAALMMVRYVHCGKLCMHWSFHKSLLPESGFPSNRVCKGNKNNGNISQSYCGSFSGDTVRKCAPSYRPVKQSHFRLTSRGLGLRELHFSLLSYDWWSGNCVFFHSRNPTDSLDQRYFS